jgi:iron complex outermembrane recepter protein
LQYRLLGKALATHTISGLNWQYMARYLLLIQLVLIQSIFAQTTTEQDSTRQLEEIVVQAYAYNRPVNLVPAAIGTLGSPELQRFNESTLVPAFNTIPGVRLEERSPGSYRLSIRGSTIRSPFGVRNVKVYWNNLPLTDPGGNTYLNQVDPGMIGTAEIIKAPGSSLYGAGTGGVLLMRSPVISDGHFVKAGLQVGSFGGELFQLGYEEGRSQATHQVQVLHQQSDGYRNQTRMSRDVVNSVFHFEVDDDQVLETFIFYSDLFYETPGGLTLTEFEADPQQARPTTAFLPGAVEQNASVHLQSFFMGVSHEYSISRYVHNQTGVYGNLVKFKNPSIRNYDHRHEQSFGARSVTTFNQQHGEVNFALLGGGEFQWGLLPTKSYENLGGKEGALMNDDEARVLQYSLFGQAEVSWNAWSTTAGLSYNVQRLAFERLSDADSKEERLTYDPEFMPRLAVMWKPHTYLSIYGSVSTGYSPPTLAEVNASNGVFNRDLQVETGTNYEAGVRAKFLKGTLNTELTAYAFRLKETIVIRREEDGAEYFVNTGSTKQNGLEVLLRYKAEVGQSGFVNVFNAWLSYAYNHYRFGKYIKDQDDFSGNELTGTPSQVISGGVDFGFRNNLYLKATCLYTGRLPLTDANTVYADSYLLPGFRVGYQQKRFEVYLGGENLLDETLSLGNDLNAIGGRYYNAAPGRNFYGGVKVNLSF